MLLPSFYKQNILPEQTQNYNKKKVFFKFVKNLFAPKEGMYEEFDKFFEKQNSPLIELKNKIDASKFEQAILIIKNEIRKFVLMLKYKLEQSKEEIEEKENIIKSIAKKINLTLYEKQKIVIPYFENFVEINDLKIINNEQYYQAMKLYEKTMLDSYLESLEIYNQNNERIKGYIKQLEYIVKDEKLFEKFQEIFKY